MIKLSRITDKYFAYSESMGGFRLLMIFLFILTSQLAVGQANVTAEYDDTGGKIYIIITNNERNKIVFFPKGSNTKSNKDDFGYICNSALQLSEISVLNNHPVLIDKTPRTISSNNLPANKKLWYYRLQNGRIEDCNAISITLSHVNNRQFSSEEKNNENSKNTEVFLTQTEIEIIENKIRQQEIEQRENAAQNIEKKQIPEKKEIIKDNNKDLKNEVKEEISNAYKEQVGVFLVNYKNILDKKKEELTEQDKVELKNIKIKADELLKKVKNRTIELQEVKNKSKENDDYIKLNKSLNETLSSVIFNIQKNLSGLNADDIVAMKKEFQEKKLSYFSDIISKDKSYLTTIENDITKINKYPLWGWVYAGKIREKLTGIEKNFDTIKTVTDNFILGKQVNFLNEDDRDYIKSGLEQEIPHQYNKISDFNYEMKRVKVPYPILTVFGISLLLFIIGMIFYGKVILNNKKIKKIEQIKKSSDDGGLIIEDFDENEIVTYTVGISDIKEKAGVDFYKVDMLSIFNETTIKSVFLSRKCIIDLYKFFSDFLRYNKRTAETGCFLIGRWGYASDSNKNEYDICIESLVEPSDDAKYGEYNLDFGAKIGITLNYEIENHCNRTGYEYVHTAWIHTHPGHGLFLSSDDINVQFQLAYSNHKGRMLAIVLDSNTPDLEMAFFTPKKDGSMNNDNDLKETLSLESLYQWAKTSPKNISLQIDCNDYYSLNLESKTNKVSKILFSGSSIINMDLTIMPDYEGLKGFFFGAVVENEVRLNDFNETGIKGEISIGCLLVVKHFHFRQILIDYSLRIRQYACVVVYCSENGKIYILTKEDLKKRLDSELKITSLLLMDLKEWTRRNR